MIKVLSIDGGGIRGIIPAIILSKIEELTKTPICKLFDIIAGTSTGGILALALSMPSESDNNIPEYSASDLVNLYSKRGNEIFESNIFQKIKSFEIQ
jgi:patatin-like phospholipase/acyl hydrolase